MVRDVLTAYLDREGFAVTSASTGTEALSVLSATDPNLVVLDVMLPGIDGLSILSELRKQSAVPVILLTARADEADRVLGLELGADDYVVKPFSPREVVARVRAVLKRTGEPRPGSSRVTFGDLVVDERTREVWVKGELVSLTPKEFDLLDFLVSSPRQVFGRAQLLEHIWDSSTAWQDPATVTVHMRRLRLKLEESPESPRWFVTVWGVGYRFEP